jgi:hypothetical protein
MAFTRLSGVVDGALVERKHGGFARTSARSMLEIRA